MPSIKLIEKKSKSFSSVLFHRVGFYGFDDGFAVLKKTHRPSAHESHCGNENDFFFYLFSTIAAVVVAHRKLYTYLSSRYGKQTVVDLKLKFLFMLLVCIELNRLLVSKLVFVCSCVHVCECCFFFYSLLYFVLYSVLSCLFSSSTCRFRIFRGV